ncbi:MAG: hypothetical protein EBY41_02230 [Proteobacteria bacterium]|nr:hypothetical protein [Pseudomonadota bacterium]
MDCNFEVKLDQIDKMKDMVRDLRSKINVLAALDADVTTSDCGDLTDQLLSMDNKLGQFMTSLMNSEMVCGRSENEVKG